LNRFLPAATVSRMRVLVINCGSSSVKLALFDSAGRAPAATAMMDEVGAARVSGSWRPSGGELREIPCPPGADHAAALDAALAAMEIPGVAAIGHRVVHGGSRFSQPALIDAAVLAAIRDLAPLAPVHAVPNALGIEAAMARFPGIPQVAVFDTAFHQTIEPRVFRYAIPEKFYRDHAIRRYGFHGTSHEFVAGEAIRLLGLDPENARVLTAHLGNGCSATAVLGGRSVDTSMGLTPLEGLVMGTRSGNVDPNLHHYLAARTGMSLVEITEMLNRQSGLSGLSGISNDMREISRQSAAGNARATLAIEIFCFRLSRELGGLAMALGGPPEALVFTGGIGENSALVRSRTLTGLAALGFEPDETRNAAAGADSAGVITRAGSAGPAAIVIPTNEEFAIARATRQLAFP
jgi:acetate kinase